MSKDIKEFFVKPSSVAEKRREALEKRKKLLKELKITDVVVSVCC